MARRALTTASAKVPEGFEKDLKYFLKHQNVIFDQFDNLFKDLSTGGDPARLRSFLLSPVEGDLLSFLAFLLLDKEAEKAIKLLVPKQLRDEAQKLAQTLEGHYSWLDEQVYQFVQESANGAIHPLTGCSVKWHFQGRAKRPQIEERLFSGMRVVFHQKVNLDDYHEEIVRKLDRSNEVLRRVIEEKLEVDQGFLKKIQTLQFKITDVARKIDKSVKQIASSRGKMEGRRRVK